MDIAIAQRYRARFDQVLDYIDANLDGDLSAEKLSAIAAFSKYHFHRQFAAIIGIGVYKYVQLHRLKRASYQLAFRSDCQIVDIALASGYEGPESFSRAFRKRIGQSPSGFRKQPQWQSWHAVYQSLSELRSHHMSSAKQAGPVSIVNFKQTRVAVLEHCGDPQLIGDSVRNFIAWRKQNHLPPKVSATFNIFYNDRMQVAPQDYRLDLCAAIESDVADNQFGVMCKTIPAGRCAMLRHIGSDDALDKAVHYLYAEWLPHSGEEVRDFPIYAQRVKFFPDVPESEAVTDIFLPIR